MYKKTFIVQISTILIFSLFFTCTLLSAAQITLKNGDIYIGEINQEDVDFQAKRGNIEIKSNQIVSFKEGKLQLRDGTTLIGSLSGDSLNISTSWGWRLKINLPENSGILW